MYYVMHSVKQLITVARASNKTTWKILLLKKGKSLSWLTFPSDEEHKNESIKCSNGDNEKNGDEGQCTDCR